MEKRAGKILVLYSWDRLWSMGPGRGSPDFALSLEALGGAFQRVTVVHPEGGGAISGELPPGVEAVSFPWPDQALSFQPCGPAWVRWPAFALNWLLRLVSYARFYRAVSQAALSAARSESYSQVAAYGFMTVRAGKRVARHLGVPLVVRLFGVSLGMKGFSSLVRLAQFEEWLSFQPGPARWVITADGSGGAEAAARLGVPPDRVRELFCGVERQVPAEAPDPQEYRRNLGLDPDCRVVLRVCRLWAQQRVERLIRALPVDLPDSTPVAAVIVGDGPEREHLKALAARLGKHVIFCGALPNADLKRHYLSADLYAATSDRTNLTNSVLEALCYGLPVLALDVGRTGRVLRDGVNARLVAPGDPDRLTAELRSVLADPALLARLAQGGFRTAAELVPDLEERRRREVEAFDLTG